jgi:hypothetical protein
VPIERHSRQCEREQTAEFVAYVGHLFLPWKSWWQTAE